MKRWWSLVGIVILWPGSAQAMELDYYTYNAFDETVAAFTRLALLFSDVNFLGFIAIFAVLGVVIGALMAGTYGMAGAKASPTAWLYPLLFGIVLIKGVVLPTGRLDIYDPVRNAYQPVDGVPDIVILIAGGLNKIERGIVEMVDTAGGTPYSEDAGSIDFSLVNSAMSVPITDVNLDRSLAQYYTDCGTLALATNGNGVTKQEFLRNTEDLYGTFAKFVNPAVYTVYYPPDNDAGQTMTCTDAWSSISALLQDPTKFSDMKNALCKVAGFDPAQTTQMTRCEAELVNASNLYGVAAGSSLPFLRSVALAKSVSEAMNSADFSLQQRMLVDRQIMAEGFGVAQAANQWIPKLRGFVTAAVLGLVPLTLLFAATPLVFRAIGLVCGLFVWLTLWGITDATAVVMARDAAVSAFNDIQNFHFGYDAILNTPDAAMQALGVFGKARTMAMGLATVISGALFHFAGYAFTQIPHGLEGQVTHAGGQAGAQTLLPEQRAALIESLTHSAGPQAALANAGFTTMAAGHAMGALRQAAGTEGYVNRSLSQGIRPAMGTMVEGEMEGGGRVGTLESAADAAGARGGVSIGEMSRQSQYSRGSRELGQTFGEMDQVGGPGAMWRMGRTQGQLHGAEIQTYRELYRNINHTLEETPGGWRKVQQQLQGTAIAISEIGDTEAYINAQKQMQIASNAAGAVAASRPGSAEMVGATRQLQDILHSEAFSDAVKIVGEAGLRRGWELPLLQSAATGDAAAEAGGLPRVAQETARTQLSEQIGRAQILEGLAGRFGYGGGSMQSLINVSKDREGARASLAITPENRERMISTLKAAGLISDFAEEQLRRSRGGEISFALDGKSYAPVSMSIRSGADTVFSTTDRAEEGRALSEFWSQSLDLSSSVGGGANLLEVENLQKGYLTAYSSLASGAHDAKVGGMWASWTASLGSGLEQRGYRADASSSVQKSWRVGVDGGASVGRDFGVAGVKGGVDGGWRRDSSDQTVTSQNVNTTASQQIVDMALQRAVGEYEKVHGPGSAGQASQIELAHRAAEIAHEQFGNLLKSEKDHTENGREANAALEKAGQLPPSTSIGDVVGEMHDAIEESRRKLGPGFVR